MAVTSAASSEMIATSSILTFDLYQIHFKPNVGSNPRYVLSTHP